MDNQMILHLRPTCSKCGEKIKPWYFSGEMFVAGKPQFGGWDWKNHICRLGLVWMIERKDNNHWLSENDTWTTDPTESKIFKTRNDAVLYKINNISLKLDCVFTEHEYSNKLV